jgi:lipoprotein-releasing system permease protein
VPWYVYLALKQLFPTGRWFPFFTVIATFSVGLGVALLIVVLSVMGGFGYEMRRTTVETQGEVQIRAQPLITNPAEVQAKLAQVPGVVATTPYAQGVVALLFRDRPAFPAIQGVDVNRVEKVIPLSRFIKAGSLDDLDDDSIILSWQLADGLGATVGDTVEIYTLLQLQRLKTDELILPRELRVAGILEFGVQQLDSSMVVVTLRTMQQLYGLHGAVHGINVKLAPGVDADEAAARINAVLPREWRARALSWFEINQDFLWVLQLEKNIMTAILLFVVLVAAFLTMSLLLVLVLKKTREIGLLGALGAGRREIALCFCLQGVLIGVVGTGLGLILGKVFLYYRNDLVGLVTRFTGSREVLARFYQFSSMPSHTSTTDLVVIIVAAIVMSTIAGFVPALLAARMKPVEALRSE